MTFHFQFLGERGGNDDPSGVRSKSLALLGWWRTGSFLAVGASERGQSQVLRRANRIALLERAFRSAAASTARRRARLSLTRKRMDRLLLGKIVATKFGGRRSGARSAALGRQRRRQRRGAWLAEVGSNVTGGRFFRAKVCLSLLVDQPELEVRGLVWWAIGSADHDRR